MRQLISVEQRHIDKGIVFDCQDCPIGLAVSEVKGSYRVHVAATCIRVRRGITCNSENDYYHVPRRVRQFINWFDRGKKVQPFRFYLRKKLDYSASQKDALLRYDKDEASV